MLSQVTPQSVANSLLTMCIKGLSMEKGQCTFIQYGNEVQLQQEYHGTIALAKRYGAGDPQAQVSYAGDEFEYEINPKTGKKVITKHVQKLENIDNDKIVGAWCLVPYADHPDWEPKVEIMTMKEIRQSWLQGPTKGQSPAHRNFPQEMAKKTVLKLLIGKYGIMSIDIEGSNLASAIAADGAAIGKNGELDYIDNKTVDAVDIEIARSANSEDFEPTKEKAAKPNTPPAAAKAAEAPAADDNALEGMAF